MSVGIFCAMSRVSNSVRIGFLLAVCGVLSACGGGGGGGGGPSFSISSSAVTFSATQGGAAPVAQVVTVNVGGGTVYIATTQSGSGFSHTFQITGTTTGAITITPDSPGIAGTFTGTISVRGCSTINCAGSDIAGSPKTINVTYKISPAAILSSNPGAIDFVTAAGLTPAAKTLDLNLSTGSSSWSSVITYASAPPFWLSVTPASAVALPESVSVNVNMAGVPPGTYSATITFSAGTLIKVVPVTLAVKDPAVNFVSPYVATSLLDGDVIIRGYGFSSVATGLQVLFDTTVATSVTLVSDTEIRATYPSLSAGVYSVSVRNASTTLPTRARLVVVDRPAFAYTAIPRINTPEAPTFAVNLTYDGERKAIYLVDSDRNRIERYKFNGVTWDTASRSVGGGGVNSRMALSPDGTEILKTGASTLSRIDPDTLASISTDPSAFATLGPGIVNLNMIAFANDGTAIGNVYAPTSGVTLYSYDMLTQTFSVLSSLDLTNRSIVASGDGSSLILPSYESLIPSAAKPVFTYDASSGALMQRATTTTRTEHASVDRTGSTFILTTAEFSPDQVTTVYDSSFAPLGILPDSAHDLRGFVVSPDGTKAYAYYSGTGKIRKFDLTVPNDGSFLEIGTGRTIEDSPGTFFNDMTISPDGGTLFIAGNQNVIVVPAP
jgi:hypothetical protein